MSVETSSIVSTDELQAQQSFEEETWTTVTSSRRKSTKGSRGKAPQKSSTLECDDSSSVASCSTASGQASSSETCGTEADDGTSQASPSPRRSEGPTKPVGPLDTTSVVELYYDQRGLFQRAWRSGAKHSHSVKQSRKTDYQKNKRREQSVRDKSALMVEEDDDF